MQIRENELQNISKDENNYDRQLNDIKSTLNALGQLPVLIQSQLDMIQAQLNNLLKEKEPEVN